LNLGLVELDKATKEKIELGVKVKEKARLLNVI